MAADVLRRKEVQKVYFLEEAMKDSNEKGAAGYIAAWALGVPASLLLIIFLLRGCT